MHVNVSGCLGMPWHVYWMVIHIGHLEHLKKVKSFTIWPGKEGDDIWSMSLRACVAEEFNITMA